MPEPIKTYLALGGNLGDVAANFSSACRAIESLPDTRITARSKLYRTKPWGLEEQPNFLNACLAVETHFPAQDFLQKLLKIERAHGRDRVRTVRYGPRTLDIDILSFGDMKCETADLVLPHPHIFARAFVLLPLSEIAGDLEISGQSVADAAKLIDTDGITRLAEIY